MHFLFNHDNSIITCDWLPACLPDAAMNCDHSIIICDWLPACLSDAAINCDHSNITLQYIPVIGCLQCSHEPWPQHHYLCSLQHWQGLVWGCFWGVVAGRIVWLRQWQRWEVWGQAAANSPSTLSTLWLGRTRGPHACTEIDTINRWGLAKMHVTCIYWQIQY